MMDNNKRPESMERITTPALAEAFIEEQVKEVRAQVGDKKVLLALSGGVDSSVVAALLIKAIGKQLICVFVDQGLMRKDEGDYVENTFTKLFDMNFVRINLWTWKEGTQFIWESLNDKLKNPARLNSNIEKVERKDGKVYVTVNGKVEEYDKIIVTSPLYVPMKENRDDGLVGMVDYFDAREDEKKLFCQIEYERYDVLAVETKPEDHPEISYYVFDNMIPKRLGHLMVYYRRWRDTVDQVITTYALRKHKRMEEIPYEKCRARVLKDLETMGNPASNVVNEWSVYYFPHVFTNAYKDGWYDKVEAMQGKYDTYYAGEIMSFGDMDETCEYSRELVERFF